MVRVVSRTQRILWPPRVVGEPGILSSYFPKSVIRVYADRMRRRPTPAEAHLASILNSINHGVLRRRFHAQHVISGKWIVDFFFFEIRLAIEVDGAIHRTAEQAVLDAQKERDCVGLDISLIRVTNEDVFGDRERLVQMLRDGWRTALDRKNNMIGNSHRTNDDSRNPLKQG